MSQRSRASRVRQHVHCDSCYSRRCRARVEASVCCAVSPCRLLCGATFHLCKEEDHLLLCPNVRVPCLNAGYGCSLHLPRSSQAAHLQACPASVVCCSMEWNRWPANDAHSHPNTALHGNLLRERGQRGRLDLDLSMALKDQDLLFHSLKMKKLFPELIQNFDEDEEEEDRKEEERRKEMQRKKKEAAEEEAGRTCVSFDIESPDEEEEEGEDEVEDEQELTQEEREAIAKGRGVSADLLQNYNTWEHMFSMEMGGCKEAGKAAAAGKRPSKGRERAQTAAPNACKQSSSGACAPSSASSSRRLAENLREFVYERRGCLFLSLFRGEEVNSILPERPKTSNQRLTIYSRMKRLSDGAMTIPRGQRKLQDQPTFTADE